MPFADINWWAVIVASIACFIVGFVWFGPKTFYPIWVRALGGDPAVPPDMSKSVPMNAVWGLLVAAILVQAIVLAAILELLRATGQSVGPWGGLATGALMGVAYAAMTSLGHRLFSGQGLKVWLIEIGQDIAGLAVMGLILGAWA
jgi:hypothetical protein